MKCENNQKKLKTMLGERGSTEMSQNTPKPELYGEEQNGWCR